jgi:hypothetical protein
LTLEDKNRGMIIPDIFHEVRVKKSDSWDDRMPNTVEMKQVEIPANI